MSVGLAPRRCFWTGRAKKGSVCSLCRRHVHLGGFIARTDYGAFVHLACMPVAGTRAGRAGGAGMSGRQSLSEAAAEVHQIGFGLSDTSARTYRAEWTRYVDWCLRQPDLGGVVPGRGGPWRVGALWGYLQHRSSSCKPSTLRGVRTKLKEGGRCYGFTLPTMLTEASPGGLCTDVNKMLNTLESRHRARCKTTGATAGVRQALGLDETALGSMISALGAGSQAGFNRLSVADRAGVAKTLALHTGAMRHGQLQCDRRTMGDVRWDGVLGDTTMWSDWHKNVRSSTAVEYVVTFPAVPRWEFQRYKVSDAQGALTGQYVTAAAVLRWYKLSRGEASDHPLFGTRAEPGSDRLQYQAWLRATFARLFPGIPRAVVERLTPHSPRAGFGTDSTVDGIERALAMAWGRWSSIAAFKKYDRVCFSAYMTSRSWYTSAPLRPVRAVPSAEAGYAAPVRSDSAVNVVGAEATRDCDLPVPRQGDSRPQARWAGHRSVVARARYFKRAAGAHRQQSRTGRAGSVPRERTRQRDNADRADSARQGRDRSHARDD